MHVLFVVDQRQYGEAARSSIELLIDELEDYGHELLNEIADSAADRVVPSKTPLSRPSRNATTSAVAS